MTRQPIRRYPSMSGKIEALARSIAHGVYNAGGDDSDLEMLAEDKAVADRIGSAVIAQRVTIEYGPVAVRVDYETSSSQQLQRLCNLGRAVDQLFLSADSLSLLGSTPSSFRHGVRDIEVIAIRIRRPRVIQESDVRSKVAELRGAIPATVEELIAFIASGVPVGYLNSPLIASGSMRRVVVSSDASTVQFPYAGQLFGAEGPWRFDLSGPSWGSGCYFLGVIPPVAES